MLPRLYLLRYMQLSNMFQLFMSHFRANVCLQEEYFACYLLNLGSKSDFGTERGSKLPCHVSYNIYHVVIYAV